MKLRPIEPSKAILPGFASRELSLFRAETKPAVRGRLKSLSEVSSTYAARSELAYTAHAALGGWKRVSARWKAKSYGVTADARRAAIVLKRR